MNNFLLIIAICIASISLMAQHQLSTHFNVDGKINAVQNSDKDSSNIFVNFPWLKSIINVSNCAGSKATVYDSGQYYFVWVETTSNSTLYFQDCTPYCKETHKQSCLNEHDLQEIELKWICGAAKASINQKCKKINRIREN